MATYVVSDLHGAYEELLQLLDTIRFGDEDELYILGDVVDRGRDGVKLLQLAMDRPNVHMIMGNHEYMCMQFFAHPEDKVIRRRWNRNSNYHTLYGFDEVDPEEKERILTFIAGLPTWLELTVNGRRYHLVHGFPADTDEDRVWDRPGPDTPSPLGEDVTLIIGHTPVCEFISPGNDEGAYVASRQLTERGDHFRILHAPGFIDIDCCVGYGMSAARIGCLRLEDGAEFYQKVRL